MAAEKKTEEKRGTTALVAGGAGFVGSHLCEALLAQNYIVYCLDNLSSGSKENIKSLLTNPNFHFVEADVTSKLDFFSQVDSIEIIFHLASLEIEPAKNFSLETLLVNSSGTRNLLEAAKHYKAKFILVSTGDIYQGTFSSNSFKYFFGNESEETIMSQHEAKRFAEALTVEYFKKYKLDASIARIKDVYGPRMNLATKSDLVDLIRQAKEGKNLVISGDGLTTINPTYVTDTVFGLLKICQAEFSGEIFNLISGEKTTLTGLAETLRLVFGNLEITNQERKDRLEFPPPPLDLETTRARLKWSSKVTLAEGLSNTFHSFSSFAPAKVVDLTPIGESEGPQVPRRSRELPRHGLIRLGVFIASFLLLFFTTALPYFNFISKADQASAKLTSALTNLEGDKTKVTNQTAQESINSSLAADKSLNSLRWIFQLSGQRVSLRSNEELLFASENTASGVEMLSQAVKAIIEAEAAADFSSAKNYLDEAQQYLIKARQDLSLGEANLKVVDKAKLAPFLGDNFSQVDQVNKKASSIATEISFSLQTTLEKLEGASTVP